MHRPKSSFVAFCLTHFFLMHGGFPPASITQSGPTTGFVFRNFRLFLHRCEPHVQPWLFDMLLATVCMSTYGPVYSICTYQPKPIWALNAVNCEPVVACGSEWGTPPPPCRSPPLVVPRGGLGDRHLVNPKFFVTAHCVVVWVTVLWGTATCILCTHGRTFCSLSLNGT